MAIKILVPRKDTKLNDLTFAMSSGINNVGPMKITSDKTKRKG